MSIIDLDKLLAPVSEDDPCGEDLSDLTEYYVLEEHAKGKEETQFSEAEPPNWKQVEKIGLELLNQGKELWVVMHLFSALTSLHGIPGLNEGIRLLYGMLETFWDNIYPELDEEDANPAEQRMNILSDIANPAGTVVNEIMRMPICKSKQLGIFSYRDYLVSRGELSAKTDKEAPQTALIEGAIKDTDPEFITTMIENLSQAMAQVEQMDGFLNETAGSQNNTTNVIKLNELIQKILDLIESVSGAVVEDAPAIDAEADGDENPDVDSDEPTEGQSDETQPVKSEGALNTRDDVYTLMGEIILWYGKNEPASPVPQIIERSRSLIGKNFLQVLASTAGPEIPQITAIFGNQNPTAEPVSPPSAKNTSFGIRNRNDIINWLSKISNWYNAHEPSSPVPLFIDKAKQLVGKSFQDIIDEIANQAQAQVEELIKNK